MHVIVIAPAPPPLTGQSAYYKYLEVVVRSYGPARFYPLRARDARHGLSEYLRKTIRSLYVLGCLLFQPNKGKALMVLDSGWGLVFAIAFAIVLRWKDYQIFLSHHTFRYVNRRSYLLNVLLGVAGDSQVNLFLCGCMKEKILDVYGRGQGFVLSNARRVEFAEPTISLSSQKDGFTLGFMSNITKEKGIEDYLAVAKRLLARGISIKAMIAGPIMDRGLVDLIMTTVAASEGKIEWVGPVYGNEKRKFIAGLHVLMLPTRYDNEAQPNVLFEALQSGVPVATVGLGCISEDLVDSESLVVPPDADFITSSLAFIEEMHRRHSVGEWQTVRRNAQAHFMELLIASREAEQKLCSMLFPDGESERQVMD